MLISRFHWEAPTYLWKSKLSGGFPANFCNIFWAFRVSTTLWLRSIPNDFALLRTVFWIAEIRDGFERVYHRNATRVMLRSSCTMYTAIDPSKSSYTTIDPSKSSYTTWVPLIVVYAARVPPKEIVNYTTSVPKGVTSSNERWNR